jgi:ankyrin repeat protein
MGGCALNAKQLAYRDRLEMGFVTPEDIERFKTTPVQQLALTSDARSFLPRYAQAQDVELMKAAAAGDTARIKTLLASGAQVNAIDEWGNSALLMTAREGQVESARMLLKAGAEVEGRGGAMSPLAASALRGHAILVRLLIHNGASVNAVGENDQSALMNAVKLNRLEVVSALIEAGANTKVIDRNGDNLLVVAVSQNYQAMLALLLKLGVSPDMSDRDGLTALYWAEYLNRPALAQLLRDAGAAPVHKKMQLIVSQPYNFGEF